MNYESLSNVPLQVPEDWHVGPIPGGKADFRKIDRQLSEYLGMTRSVHAQKLPLAQFVQQAASHEASVSYLTYPYLEIKSARKGAVRRCYF